MRENKLQDAFNGINLNADLNGLDEYRRKSRKEALAWLNNRFTGVQESEVSRGLANDVAVIRNWEAACEKCEDITSCPHSCAMLVIGECIGADNRRYFSTSAKMCEKALSYAKAKKLRKALKLSGIPPERWKDGFPSFKVFSNPLLKAAKGLACDCAQQHIGIIIGGPVGCGKTHLAVATGLAALKEGRSVLFALTPSLLTDLIDESLKGESELYSRAKSADVLILDDLGTNKDSEWKDERLFMLIDYRYSHDMQTIVTTNAVSEQGFRSLLRGDRGARIFSRLMGMTQQIWLAGIPDYRMSQRDVRMRAVKAL